MAAKVTMVAATSLLLLLLLLVAPPFSSAAIRRPSPNTGKFVAQGVRSILKQSYKSFRDYLKDRAQQGDADLPGRGNNKDDHQLGSSAAHSYGAFTFDLSLGTRPPQTLSVVMDITSELVWTQCGEPCASCPVLTTPSFQPGNSGSFAPIGCDDDDHYCQSLLPGYRCAQPGDYCDFKESFIGGGDTSGYLANETFSFGTTAIPSMPFGCSNNITVPDLAGASGFVGFSRGPLSLVSQLGITSFSYLIASPDDAGNVEGSLSWSWDAAAAAPARGSTPLLVPTDNQNPYWYYVKLTGVEVDGQLLTAIPAGTFDVQADGSGGVFLSTTLPVTYLDQAAYKVLRAELVDRFQSQGVIPVEDPAGDMDHLCFPTQNFAPAKVPKLALVFDGAGAAMELTVENYFFAYDEQQTCLTILPSIGGSALGSLLQVDRTMTYELHADGGGRLTFETAAAAAAGAPTVPLVIIIATLLAAAWGPQSLF